MARPSKQADSAQPTEHCDVLVYVAHGGTIRCLWNSGTPLPSGAGNDHLMIPEQDGPRLEPGLSFVPGALWGRTQETNSYKEGLRDGLLKPAAGHGGDLESEWAKIGDRGISGMLDMTFDVDTLQRLQAIETDARSPRLEVSDLIDARLERLAVRVAAQKSKKRAERHRARPGQRLPGMPI